MEAPKSPSAVPTEENEAPMKTTTIISLLASCGLCEGMMAAVKLGIFEYLGKCKVPCTAERIASDLSLNLDATTVLVDACVSLGLLMKEIPDGRMSFAKYTITQETEKFLLRDSPKTLVEYINLCLTQGNALLPNLNFAVREGCNLWLRSFNKPSEEVFPNIYENEAKLISYMSAMGQYTEQAASWFVTAFDVSQYRQMCDIGGSGGKLAYTACTAYPDMKITVLDMPLVVNSSSHFKPSRSECPNQGNVSFVAGDFFEDELPSADLYCISQVLHNWSDEKGHLLMDKVSKKLPSGGGILIKASLLDDDKRGPKEIMYISLLMGVVTHGREKSGKEYKEMLLSHGFIDVQYKSYHDPYFGGAIFAKKP